ncbi:MAG: ABC transporter permease [Candidatus Nanopelagicaceae bacterium]|nr:ABC transporter permease [Candidatus Nanopelagicaceae bacterium]
MMRRSIYGPSRVSYPAIALGIFLIGAPLVVVTLYSFLKRGLFGSGVVYKFTTDAYSSILIQTNLIGERSLNTAYLQIIWRSILLALIVTVICLIVGVPTAIWIALQKKTRQKMLILLVTIPFWVNVLARTYAWMLLLADRGLIDHLGGPTLLYTDWATLIGLTYAFLPFMILPVYAVAEKLDFRMLEAGFDLGASGWRVLTKVLLPSLKYGMLAGVAVVFIPALGAYVQPSLLGGNKSMLIGSLINDQFGESRNWPVGSALAVLLLLMTVFVLGAFKVREKSKGNRAEVTLAGTRK